MSETTPKPVDKRGRWIPWAIVAFFVAQAILYAWFTNLAVRNNPGTVIERSYAQGLRYNEVIAAAEAQEKLGWAVKLAIAPVAASPGHLRLTADMQGPDGKPLSGARLSYYLTRPTNAHLDRQGAMIEEALGQYAAQVDAMTGLWEFRVLAERDGQRFQTAERLVAP